MDSKELNTIDIKKIMGEPYVKVSIIIAFIIIVPLYLTQSMWMNIGIKAIQPEYQAEDILSTNNIPDGTFILSGNYTYISEWINTSKLNCEPNSEVKLFVYSYTEPGMKYFKNIAVMNVIEGCK